MTRADWILRPILWFVTASTIHVLLHTAGPAFNLIAGLLSLAAYWRWSKTAAGLPLLYLATFGIAMCAGYATSLLSTVASAAVLLWQGRQLRRFIPAKAGRIFGTIGVLVVPLVAGTAIIILINQPRPAAFAFARMREAALGIFAVAGALTPGGQPSSAGRSFRLWWIDGTIAIAAVLALRIAARGIALTP